MLGSKRSTANDIFNELKNKGDFLHNIRILKGEENGSIVVAHGPSDLDPNRYLPCKFCLKFYVSDDLWRHSCLKSNLVEDEDESDSKRAQSESKHFLDVMLHSEEGESCGNDTKLYAFFARMWEGDVKTAAKTDSLILSLAKRLLARLTLREYAYISERIRRIALLLIELRHFKPQFASYSMQDFLRPCYYNVIISCIQELCGFNVSNTDITVATPGKALKYGNDLNKLCTTMHALLLKSEVETDQMTMLKNLMKLIESSYNEDVSSHASQNLNLAKHKKPQVIPLTEDVVIFSSYLDCEIERLNMACTNKIITAHQYSTLVEVTLCKLVIFNRKRVGDVDNFTTAEWKEWLGNGALQTVDNESLATMDALERKLAERLVHASQYI
jgi:hypothetical protein